MREPLVAWLAGLSTSDRKVFLRLAAEGGSGDPGLAGLLRAISFEIVADLSAEAAMMHQLDVQRQADIESIAEGAVWPNGTPSHPAQRVVMDVESGEWHTE